MSELSKILDSPSDLSTSRTISVVENNTKSLENGDEFKIGEELNKVTEKDIDAEPFELKEGQATIIFPSKNEVFYNPVQEFNRDMSISAIQTFIHQFVKEKREKHIKKHKDDKEFIVPKPSVLEALAATGLRSIRYAKEIKGIGPITANDLEPQAVDAIQKNFTFNGLTEPDVKANLGDACDVMYSHRNPSKHFDIIDLDPYGSASPFIDAAVQSVSNGGLLCVTCTDLSVLASSQYTETCYAKYGGIPLKAGFCHEAALRMVIQTLMSSAARYKRAIQPLVSCSIDFYVRIFVRVVDSAAQVKFNASNTSVVFRCYGCGTFDLSSIGRVSAGPKAPKFGPTQGPPVNGTCNFCHSKLHMAGPMYSGPLHNKEFVLAMLNHVKNNKESFKTNKRMEGMLTVISEEIEAPLFYLPCDLSTIVRASTPDYTTLVSAFLHLGYKVSPSHCAPGSLKTDAPADVIWDIMRQWVKKYPVKIENFPKGAPGLAILDVEPSREVDFTHHPQAHMPSRFIKLVRYQMNPEKNWGPKARHRRQDDDEKSCKRQK